MEALVAEECAEFVEMWIDAVPRKMGIWGLGHIQTVPFFNLKNIQCSVDTDSCTKLLMHVKQITGINKRMFYIVKGFKIFFDHVENGDLTSASHVVDSNPKFGFW